MQIFFVVLFECFNKTLPMSFQACFLAEPRAIMVAKPDTKVINLFSCSILLSVKFIMLINFKMATIVAILNVLAR